MKDILCNVSLSLGVRKTPLACNATLLVVSKRLLKNKQKIPCCFKDVDLQKNAVMFFPCDCQNELVKYFESGQDTNITYHKQTETVAIFYYFMRRSWTES